MKIFKIASIPVEVIPPTSDVCAQHWPTLSSINHLVCRPRTLRCRRRGAPQVIWDPRDLDSNSDSASPEPCLILIFPPSWQNPGRTAGLSPWRQEQPTSGGSLFTLSSQAPAPCQGAAPPSLRTLHSGHTLRVPQMASRMTGQKST